MRGLARAYLLRRCSGKIGKFEQASSVTGGLGTSGVLRHQGGGRAECYMFEKGGARRKNLDVTAESLAPSVKATRRLIRSQNRRGRYKLDVANGFYTNGCIPCKHLG